MRFDVYCDESRHDLLCSKHPAARYLVIGSLWLENGNRQQFKTEIHALRDRYKIGGEFKWLKVSPSRLDFYKALIDWFFEKQSQLRFRCIAVAHDQVNLIQYHQNDQELGFYKFYYQMLHHWILDFNEYAIFCDWKPNKDRKRLQVLQRCLSCANLSSTISTVQALASDESVLLQVVDVLTGISSAKLNNALGEGKAKEQLVQHVEQRLGRRIAHTYRSEAKFNVFQIDLKGGW